MFTCGMGAVGLCLNAQCGAGQAGKGPGERAVTEELDSLGLITPR